MWSFCHCLVCKFCEGQKQNAFLILLYISLILSPCVLEIWDVLVTVNTTLRSAWGPAAAVHL